MVNLGILLNYWLEFSYKPTLSPMLTQEFGRKRVSSKPLARRTLRVGKGSGSRLAIAIS
jgi:hypothetical protein